MGRSSSQHTVRRGSCSKPLDSLFAFLVLLLFATDVVKGDILDDVLSAKISELNIRGASVAIFDSNTMDTPITRGYGKVSSGENSPSVTPDTVFMIASLSKPFAASAVAALVDRGILASIDEDICKSFYGNEEPFDNSNDLTLCRNPQHPDTPVTWRSILTHRSSLKCCVPEPTNVDGDEISPQYGPTGGYIPGRPAVGNPTCPLKNATQFYRALLTQQVPTEVGAGVLLENNVLLDWYDLQQSTGGLWEDYSPGFKTQYSNLAYGYLAALIEWLLLASPSNTEDPSFSTFYKETLFDPLEMTRTAWFRTNLPLDTLEAVPVSYNKNKGYEDVGHYCFIDYASGGLRTSANDMAKWAGAMLSYGSPALWSLDVGRNVVSCQEHDSRNVLVDEQDCEFGYGWQVVNNALKEYGSTAVEAPWWLVDAFGDYDWKDGILHEGGEAGSQTNLVILPSAGVFVAVITNTDGNSPYAAQELTVAAIEALNKQYSEDLPTNNDASSKGWRLSLFKLWDNILLLLAVGSLAEVIL